MAGSDRREARTAAASAEAEGGEAREAAVAGEGGVAREAVIATMRCADEAPEAVEARRQQALTYHAQGWERALVGGRICTRWPERKSEQGDQVAGGASSALVAMVAFRSCKR
jgi:hypothetical protein